MKTPRLNTITEAKYTVRTENLKQIQLTKDEIMTKPKIHDL